MHFKHVTGKVCNLDSIIFDFVVAGRNHNAQTERRGGFVEDCDEGSHTKGNLK